MKQRVFAVFAGLALAVSVVGGASAAPPGLEPNEADQQSERSGNCIAYYSAQWQHNGQASTLGQGGDPSGHDGGESRGEEIKRLQAECNSASDK